MQCESAVKSHSKQNLAIIFTMERVVVEGGTEHMLHLACIRQQA